MKKILITGKGSYVGMSVKKYLEQWPKKYHIEELDVKGEEWKKFDFSKFDVVFHVAGLAHRKINKNDDEQISLYYKVNTDLAEAIAKKAKKEKVKQFIFMSTASVYGDGAPIGKNKIITDKTPPAPDNVYGDSKLQAEKLLQKIESKEFKVAILRPPMIYGKECKGNYQLLRKIALKSPFFPYVKNSRSMIFIDNFSSFIKNAIDHNISGIYHPSNSKPINTTEMVKLIAKNNDKTLKIVKHLSPLLRFASLFTQKVNKAFGNFVYDKDITDAKFNYNITSFEESINITESGDA